MNKLSYAILVMTTMVLFSQAYAATPPVAPDWRATAKQIFTCEQLQNMDKDANTTGGRYNNNMYILMNDLDCSSIPSFVTQSNDFSGKFDGQNHIIKNLNFANDAVGLFNRIIFITDTEIMNIVFDSPKAKVTGNFGVLGQFVERTKISGVHVRNANIQSIVSYGSVGGLVGVMRGGSIYRSSVTQSSIIGNYNVGGLVGVGIGSIEESFSSGSIVGLQVGGLIGYLGDPGYTVNVVVKNSYSLMDVKRNNDESSVSAVGGLAGVVSAGRIVNSYAVGKNGRMGDYVGGAVGLMYGPSVAQNVYWDNQKTGVFLSAGSSFVGGQNTKRMYSKYNYLGWDFNTVWSIRDGKEYPKLLWQK